MELAKMPMISLQRQTLTNFASSVWISANKQYLRLPLEINRKSMNDAAIAQLKPSVIGKHIKEMTMMILNDVGHEIFDWLFQIKDHVTDITLEHQLANLSWTVEGPLNKPKMTRLLLENQSDLDLSFIFKMACEYCLEDKIRELWPRIREELDLNDFYDQNLMVQYWIYKLGGRLLDSSFLNPLLEEMSIDIKFFVRVVYSCKFRKSTVKFLFNNLSEDEKIQALEIIFKPSIYSREDILKFSEVPGVGYLLSQLNYTQMCKLVSEIELPKQLFMNISCFACPSTHFLKALDHCFGKMEGAIEATNGNDLVEFADGAFEFVRCYNSTILFRYCWTRFPKEGLKEAMEDFRSLFLFQIFRDLADNKDVVSIKMVIDSIDPESYAKKLLPHYHLLINETLASFDTDLLKYYLARTVVCKNMAKNLLKDSYYLENMETTTGILIQLFPELDPNCAD